MESNIFSERNIILVAIVIITILLLKITNDSILELFEVEKDEEDGLITNFMVDPKTNIINYIQTEDNTTQPIKVAGFINDTCGNKIMVKFNKIKFNTDKDYIELDNSDHMIMDETGMFPRNIVSSKDFDEIKTKYSELEISNKNLESSSKLISDKFTLAEEELVAAEETKDKFMLYGGIGGGVLLLLCIISTIMAFKKK